MTNEIQKATHSGTLKIGDLEFPCSVLSDGTRILTQSNFMTGMEMYYSGWISKNRNPDDATAGLPPFLAFKNLKPFIEKHLGDLQSITLKYRTERGSLAHGIKAETIPKICEVWLDAEEHGKLGERQKKIAKKAKIIIRGLAHVGIIALVDEATGYQYERAKTALAEILENFIAKEIRPWVKTFPDDFYAEMFRLKGWQYVPVPKGKPPIVGKYTNDIVYARLAPFVLEELKKVTPKNSKGQYKARFHQSLTENIGYQKLKEHLAATTALMKASANWTKFKSLLNRALPRYDETLPLDFGDLDD